MGKETVVKEKQKPKKLTPTKSGINKELKALDQEWSEIFSRMEAMQVVMILTKPAEHKIFQSVMLTLSRCHQPML